MLVWCLRAAGDVFGFFTLDLRTSKHPLPYYWNFWRKTLTTPFLTSDLSTSIHLAEMVLYFSWRTLTMRGLQCVLEGCRLVLCWWSLTYSCESSEGVFKALIEVPFNYGRENILHCFLVKCIDTDQVEVTEEPMCHMIATATRGTHCGQHNDVFKE